MANSLAHHDPIYYSLGFSVSANSHFIIQNMYENVSKSGSLEWVSTF